MAFDPLTAVADLISNVGGKFIDRLFPDKVLQAKERAGAELAVLQVSQDGAIRETQAQLSAILAEANSADPWTSRARPTFLYVVYVMILISIPMGLLSAFKPDMALAVAAGMQAWLAAIPDPLYALFGVGYLGYTGARMLEKKNGVA